MTCDLCQSCHYFSRGMITAVTPRVTHSTPTYSDGKYHFDKFTSAPDVRSWSSRTQSLPGNHFGEETPAPIHRLWVLKSIGSSSPSHSPLPSSPFWSLPSASMSLSSHASFPVLFDSTLFPNLSFYNLKINPNLRLQFCSEFAISFSCNLGRKSAWTSWMCTGKLQERKLHQHRAINIASRL